MNYNQDLDHMATLELDKYSSIRVVSKMGIHIVMGDICIMSSHVLGKFTSLAMANLFKLAILDHKITTLQTKIRNKQKGV